MKKHKRSKSLKRALKAAKIALRAKSEREFQGPPTKFEWSLSRMLLNFPAFPSVQDLNRTQGDLVKFRRSVPWNDPIVRSDDQSPETKH